MCGVYDRDTEAGEGEDGIISPKRGEQIFYFLISFSVTFKI